MPQLTLVLGVHRSGTSLLTAGMVASGVSAGDFSDSSDADNPDGYGEHPQVRQFNDRLLTYLGASWDNWGFYAPDAGLDAPDLAPWRDDAAALLRRIFAGPGPFVLKDPRCLTLWPFWQVVVPAAGFDLDTVMILRDPDEVAESQRQRAERRPASFPLLSAPEPMAALWTVTMHSALMSLSGSRTLLLGHAELISSPAETMAAVAAHLGLSPDPNSIREFSERRVKLDLYRARPRRRVDGAWSREAAGLFLALIRGGLPRILTSAEARTIVSERQQLPALMSTLPAVYAMVRSIQTDRARRLEQVALEPLRQLVWGFGACFFSNTPEAHLACLHDKVATMIGEDFHDIVVLVALARIEERRGRWGTAEKWLHRIALAHPANAFSARLLKEFEERRQAAEKSGLTPISLDQPSNS